MDDAAPRIPATLRALMAEVGPRWGTAVAAHVRLMNEQFTPVLAGAPKHGVEVAREIAYGTHPRQVLDVFRPSGADACPVIVFLHGGAFVDGERNRTPEIYANVLHYFARHRIVGVNMEYRLAPEARHPAGLEDVGAALAWVRAHVGAYGGDPDRVFLMGHSAGAAHAAGFAYGDGGRPLNGGPLAGLIVVSGRVRAEASADNPNARKVEAYYGTDPARHEALSPVVMVTRESVPTLIAFGEFENPLIDLHCLELAFRLAQAKRRAPPLFRLAGHNHTSMIAHFNTEEDTLGRAILDFVASPR